MLDVNRIWNCNVTYYNQIFPDQNYYGFANFYFDSTTIIDSVEYQNLVRVNPDFQSERTYLLRENIATKKVYIYYTESNTEYLLFDFDVQIGDTITGHNIIYSEENRVIQNIGTETIFGITTKFYELNVNDCSNIRIYEGVG